MEKKLNHNNFIPTITQDTRTTVIVNCPTGDFRFESLPSALVAIYRHAEQRASYKYPITVSVFLDKSISINLFRESWVSVIGPIDYIQCSRMEATGAVVNDQMKIESLPSCWFISQTFRRIPEYPEGTPDVPSVLGILELCSIYHT